MQSIFNNKNKGFSLVELIVVIAIMAVMAAILAPALLGYVEKSRMQKDDSAMDEVVESVHLALADQSVYDEVLEHSVYDNVSCYIDKQAESEFADFKVNLKAAHGEYKEQYTFGDETRLLDETVYFAAGNMRGMTITFSPGEIATDTYDLKNGVINKFVGRKTGYLHENPELYNRVRSTIGDTLKTTSQTYRNSDYTLFIRIGSTGGAEAIAQDAIQVWGQFNGTNLTERDHKYQLSTGRVVGTAGANDAANNAQKNESDSPADFSENELKTLSVWCRGTTYTIKYRNNMTWEDWFNSEEFYDSSIPLSISNSNVILADGECSHSHSGGASWEPTGVNNSHQYVLIATVQRGYNGGFYQHTYSWITADALIDDPLLSIGCPVEKGEYDYCTVSYSVTCARNSYNSGFGTDEEF